MNIKDLGIEKADAENAEDEKTAKTSEKSGKSGNGEQPANTTNEIGFDVLLDYESRN